MNSGMVYIYRLEETCGSDFHKYSHSPTHEGAESGHDRTIVGNYGSVFEHTREFGGLLSND